MEEETQPEARGAVMTMAFGDQVFLASQQEAVYQLAQDTADSNGAPVMIMEREGWLAIIEEPPDEAECDPYGHGWQDVALVDPHMEDEAPS